MTWVYDVETTINPYDKKNRGLGRGSILTHIIYIYPANKYHIPQKKARLKMIFLRQKFTLPTPTPKNHYAAWRPFNAAELLGFEFQGMCKVHVGLDLGRIIPVSE